ncbi:hypothetical protein BJ546DRAFT_382737 [Cryomyces antarcticus]
MKRKTLHDYFHKEAKPAVDECTSHGADSPKKPKSRLGPSGETRGLLNKSDLSVPGLSVLQSFVSPVEQATLLAFLDSQTWRTDLSRRTKHYGGTYCLMPSATATPAERAAISQTIVTAPPIAPELHWLIERMVSRAIYAPTARPEFCIVNEYLRPHGISAHVENFRFGEPVCSLTLGSGDFMRFHELAAPHDGSVRSGAAAKAPRTGKRVDVWLPSGSLCVLRGKARYQWQHEIMRGRRGRVGEGWRRVSLTFRVEKGKTTATADMRAKE